MRSFARHSGGGELKAFPAAIGYYTRAWEAESRAPCERSSSSPTVVALRGQIWRDGWPIRYRA
jgi:hypothetical protein